MKRRICFLFVLIFVLSGCNGSQREDSGQNNIYNIDTYANQIQLEEFNSRFVSIIGILDKKVIFSDANHDDYEAYYFYDVERETTSLIKNVPYDMASSGVTIMMPPTSLIITSYNASGNLLQRSISILDGNNGRSILHDVQSVTEKDSPFIYLSKIDQNSFISTELNESNSKLKLHNLETGSITTLLQYEQANDNATGRIIANATVSNETILLLVNKLQKDSIFVIEQYNMDGEYLATLNSESCNYLFEGTAPLWMFAVQDFLVLYNWNMESAIFKVDGNELQKIDYEEELQISMGGLANCSSSNDLNFLFLLRPNSNRDNTLYALDLGSKELKKVILEKQGYDIDYTVMGENGDAVLIYTKKDADFSDTQTMLAYYLEKETIEQLLNSEG